MAKQHSHRGFTRLDALVAGVVCLVLVLLVSTLHAMTREHYFRTVCAAHLAEIGRTMFVYAADNETALPRASGSSTTWGKTANWAASDRHMAYGIASDGSGGKATINASFFLLVKYYEALPGLFVCPGDEGTAEFSLADVVGINGVPGNLELADVWDFGPPNVSCKSCSFALHFPFQYYALTTTEAPDLAVAADRNPWIKSPASDAASFATFRPDLDPYTGTADTARVGNSPSHLKDGQNVLFLDGRVTFETRSYCGVDQDNIYLLSNWPFGATPMGTIPTTGNYLPLNKKDSVLLHDPSTWGNAETGSRN